MTIHEIYESLEKKLAGEERDHESYKAMAKEAERDGEYCLAKGLSMIAEEEKSHWEYIHDYLEGHKISGGDDFDSATAMEWMHNINNADGSIGAHWPLDHIKQVMAQKDIDMDPVELWVAVNMMYADYYPVAKAMNMNNIGFYWELAKCFLEDEDAVKDKLAAYYHSVVKH